MSTSSQESREDPSARTESAAPGAAEQRTMRREIPQRSTAWARAAAAAVGRTGITPNMISSASVVVAAIGCAALVGSGWAVHVHDDGLRAVLLIIAALAAPLRLLLNMLDGMVAVEGGKHSPVGDLYNEVPDRLADLLFLAGAGYAAAALHGGITIGWVAASLAVLTAYVRSLGAAQGLSNHFDGPMAKPRRMWLLMLGCLLSLLEPALLVPLGVPRGQVLGIVLAVIAVGALATVVIRLQVIGGDLRGRAAEPDAEPGAAPGGQER